MERNYYMVRIKDNRFDLAESKGVVGIGWSEYDFSTMSVEDVDVITDVSISTKKRNAIKRFIGIQKGDIIIVPHWNCIWLAEASDKHIYDETSKDTDIANQIMVKYQTAKDGSIRLFPRNSLSEGLSRRLRMQGGYVLDLKEYGEEIQRIYDNTDYSISTLAAEHENKIIEDFKEQLLYDICNGNVFLKAGGRGLEELVYELFEIEGFDAHILPKTAFSDTGDADVKAEKHFANSQITILAQVKHHRGNTGMHGVRQLEELKSNGENLDCDKLMLITSGSISDEVRNEAENNDIVAMDGKELVDWICENGNISKLSKETRARLRINILPMMWGK